MFFDCGFCLLDMFSDHGLCVLRLFLFLQNLVLVDLFLVYECRISTFQYVVWFVFKIVFWVESVLGLRFWISIDRYYVGSLFLIFYFGPWVFNIDLCILSLDHVVQSCLFGIPVVRILSFCVSIFGCCSRIVFVDIGFFVLDLFVFGC